MVLIVAAPAPKVTSGNATQSFPLWRKGLSVEDVMECLDRARSTVLEYLCAYIRRERPASVAAWVSKEDYEKVTQAAKQVGAYRLKPIFLVLEEKVPYETIKIEHKDKRLHCSSQNAERKPVEWNYTTDGKETRGKIGDESYNSILKWEGSALLINTLANGRARNHAQMDRWRLSRDGKTLTIRRQVETLRGEVESIFIYEKQ